MPRCWKCGSTDLAPLFDSWQCNDCGQRTMMATGRGPAEGLYSNSDILGVEAMAFMAEHHPEEYRMLADTVAGQPDPGTEPGGNPVSDTMPSDEPVETPAPEEPTPEPVEEPAEEVA